MNYEIYFIKSNKNKNEKEFIGYFKDRLHYKVKNGVAFYNNRLTGVNFLFVVKDKSKDNEIWAVFNMNFYESTDYEIESANEVDAFVYKFGTKVINPQEGDEIKDFNRDNFIKACKALNQV